MVNNIKFKGRTIFSRNSKKIGVNGENEQEMLIFSFDNFHEGTCYLEILFPNNDKVFIELEQENETYILEVKNSLLSQVGNLKMQLTIVNTGNTVWKSEIFEMMVLTAINATETIEEDYPNFVETTTARLLEITGELLEKANISDIPTKNSELENDSGYLSEFTETDPTVPSHVKNISQENISDWNNKSDFSGSYNDLTDKPEIPSVDGLASEEYVDEKIDEIEVPSKTSDLTNDSGFITNAVNDLANYYKKSETYTQTEINQRISAIPKFAIEVVNSLPTQEISATTIYLLVTGAESQNLYTEYIYINNAWEKLGTQTVDLTGYATESWVNSQISDFLTATQINSLLADKVDKVIGKGLSTEDYTTEEKTKLSGIETEANKTIIDSALSSSSTNPVQNKKVKEAIDELNQTLLNQIPTGTVEGNSIMINDSSDLPVKDVVIKGKTEQNGTPTPDSKVDVHRVTGTCAVNYIGKNLLNKNYLKNYTGNGITITKNIDGSLTLNGTATGGFGVYSNTFNLELPAGDYIHSISTSIVSGVYCSLNNRDNTMISPYQTGNKDRKAFTLTTKTTYTYYFIWIDNGTVLNNYKIYPMITKAIEDLTFEPYKEFNYPLTLGNIELYQADYVYRNNEKWYVCKNKGKYVFTGNENWSIGSTTNSNFRLHLNFTSVSSNFKKPATNGTIPNIKSNMYITVSADNTWNGSTGIALDPWNNLFICDTNNYNTRESLSNFIADLQSLYAAETPMYLIYELATPTITEITDTTLINQLEALINAETYKNVTNIITTGEDLAANVQVVYRKDLETVLNNLQAQILA